MLTIDTEIIKNLERARMQLYDDFDERTNVEIALKCNKGFLESIYEDPFKRTDIFYSLIDDQYTTNLRENCSLILDLFRRHGIAYRLCDINNVLHGYHRMTFIWVVDRQEYGFDFIWKSDETNNYESFYRLGLINRCGDICNGDILDAPHQTIRYFCDDADLPAWFASGLAHNT
jgi:hypothetical protein